MVGLRRRERREVVGPDERFRARRQQPHIHPPRPVQCAPPHQRPSRGPRQHPVAVRARGCVPPRVKPLVGSRAGQYRHVVGQQRIQTVGANRLAGIASHLPPSMHAGVRPPRNRQLHLAIARTPPQQDAESPLDLPLYRPLTRLTRPAGEPTPVVLQNQPDLQKTLRLRGPPSDQFEADRAQTNSNRLTLRRARARAPNRITLRRARNTDAQDQGQPQAQLRVTGQDHSQTSSSSTISVASERRGPSFRIRV